VPMRIAAVVIGLLAAVLGLFVAAAALVAWDAVTKLGTHQFGMCPGSGSREQIAGYPKPLSDWIEENLDEIAFGEAREDPLTFGDLWGVGSDGDKNAPADNPALRRINLEVITTNLNQGRPYRLPVDIEHLYFDPKELADVFSPRLLRFLAAHARPVT